MKVKKFQNFIAKAQKEVKKQITNNKVIAKPITPPKTKSLYQPTEYQRITMDALDSSVLESGCYDDRPMIFLGKERELTSSQQLLNNPEQIQEILKSFHNYRDIIEGIGQDHNEIDGYR